MNKIWVSAFGFIIFTAVAWAAPVPDTGQTKCYDNTAEIPCPSPGQPFYGQDANYSINPMSYTKLDSSGNTLNDSAAYWLMVKDNVTGLIWESKTNDGTTNDKDNIYTWYDPADLFPGSPGDGTDAKDFIDALNSERFGGYSNWRMPTIKELGTIIDYDIIGPEPAINGDYFPNTQASFYWSSTTSAMDMNDAWGVYFYVGTDGFNTKLSNGYIRAVSGGQSGSEENIAIASLDAVNGGSPEDASTDAGGYVDNGDGTVTDTSTGIMWQQTGPSGAMNWEQALAYCEGLNLGGYNDWRLPTKKALRTLVDFTRVNPSIDTTYFIEASSSFYWSSTSNAYIADFAWGVYFNFGTDGFYRKLSTGNVRAVRGGQAPTSTGCMSTIDENLLLHIPYLSNINPFFGTLSLWADFVYEFNPTYPTLILFKFTIAEFITNPSFSCTASTISDDLKIHIPDLLLPDGSTHLWVDLEYSPALSSHDNAFFVVTSYGFVSN